MPLLKEETYTIEDIYALPDGKRAELIDGHIYYMAPPSRKHQDISVELSSAIKDYIRSHAGKCKVYAAPFAVYRDEKADTYVEPDISVICRILINWMTKDVKVRRIGLSRLFLRAADRWTIVLSCLSTGLLVFANIGLLILQKILFWYMILKRTDLNNILCKILLRQESMMI